MQKLFILLICQMLATVGAFAVTRTAILRIHNGTGITYDMEQLATAVAEAEAGDTLCLNEGTYNLSDTLAITQPITMMGAGQSTHIIGVINVSIDGETTLTSRMLDAVRITGSVLVTKSVKGFSMRKIRISENLSWQAAVSDVLVDRCNINNYTMDSNLRSANFVNCRIANLTAGPNENCEITYLNCSFSQVYYNDMYAQHVATYLNCIIHSAYYNAPFNYSTLYNCLTFSQLNYTGANTVSYNCNYENGDNFWSDSTDNYTRKTKGELIEAGYLGNDGTVVGVEGGNTPYTLVPSSIIVTESLLKIDTANKKLNVTLKVASN